MATATLVRSLTSTSRRRRRAGAVVGAVLAALLVYALARLATGHLDQPAFGAGQPTSLSAGSVALAAAVGALLGWAAIAALERVSAHASAIWTIGAPIILLASLSMPLSGHGIGVGDRVAMILMHLVVGTVVIGLFAASSPSGGSEGR